MISQNIEADKTYYSGLVDDVKISIGSSFGQILEGCRYCKGVLDHLKKHCPAPDPNRKENYNFVGIMEADNLNHAFELSNTDKNIKGAYSMSVGDVLVNMHTGKTYIVAPISFHQLYLRGTQSPL